MKKKSILVFVLTIGMFLINSEYAMAATGISDVEELVLDRLREGIEMNGIVVQIPVSYLNQVENELMKNDIDITAEQAVIVNSKIDEATEMVKTMSMADIVNLKNSDTSKQLIGLVEETAAVLDYSVSINMTDGSVNIINSDGNFVFVTKNAIKQTGFELTETVIVGSILVILLATCIVLADRKNLLVQNMKV